MSSEQGEGQLVASLQRELTSFRIALYNQLRIFGLLYIRLYAYQDRLITRGIDSNYYTDLINEFNYVNWALKAGLFPIKGKIKNLAAVFELIDKNKFNPLIQQIIVGRPRPFLPIPSDSPYVDENRDGPPPPYTARAESVNGEGGSGSEGSDGSNDSEEIVGVDGVEEVWDT